MFQVLFWKNPSSPILAQNAKKMEVFRIFIQIHSLQFAIFCTKPSVWSRKKNYYFVFLGKFKNYPFWPKLTQIWPKFGHIWLYQSWSKLFEKNCCQKLSCINKFVLQYSWTKVVIALGKFILGPFFAFHIV